MNNYELFEIDKETINKLLKIDNKIEQTNITVEMLQNYYINSNNYYDIKGEKLLLITEGDPFLTLDIIKSCSNKNIECILFINRSFVGINKWLIECFAPRENAFIYLDSDDNYNKYIKKNITVIPIGSNELISQVEEDFN